MPGNPHLFPHPCGDDHPGAKLSSVAVAEIRGSNGYIKRRRGHTVKDLARRYNVSPSAIEKVLWGQVGATYWGLAR